MQLHCYIARAETLLIQLQSNSAHNSLPRYWSDLNARVLGLLPYHRSVELIRAYEIDMRNKILVTLATTGTTEQQQHLLESLCITDKMAFTGIV